MSDKSAFVIQVARARQFPAGGVLAGSGRLGAARGESRARDEAVTGSARPDRWHLCHRRLVVVRLAGGGERGERRAGSVGLYSRRSISPPPEHIGLARYS